MMGMYDDVVGLDLDCKKCGKKLTGWQSKDGPCDRSDIHFSRVSNFYTHCSNEDCNEWYEINPRDVGDLSTPVNNAPAIVTDWDYFKEKCPLCYGTKAVCTSPRGSGEFAFGKCPACCEP